MVDDVRAAPVTAAEPKADRPRHRRRRPVVAVAVVAALAAGGLVSKSSMFAVGRVTVRGASNLAASTIIRESGVKGRNALWLDTGAVERVLERDPWISRAVVSRSLPSSVSITIDERVPVAAIVGPAGYTVVAADGTVLGTQRTAARLPVISPGTIASRVQGTYGGPTRVLAALSSIVRGQVASVSQDANGDVAMRLRSGTEVRFGPATDVQAKADALSAVLAYAAAQKARVASIDVRFPAAPSARLDDGTSITPSS
jgi:cell division protein FtsQ